MAISSNTPTAAMTDLKASVASIPAPTAPAPQAIPSVSSSVTIDWGSWAAQALHASEGILGSIAGVVETDLLAMVPFGSIISSFIGPTVVASYVQQGLQTLEGILEGRTLTSSGAIEKYVFNAMIAFEPALVHLLGDTLIPMIEATVLKLLPGYKPSSPVAKA